MAILNELLLLATRMEDGNIKVELDAGADVESTVAAIIRAAATQGCDMGRVFRLIHTLRMQSSKPTDEPMVIT